MKRAIGGVPAGGAYSPGIQTYGGLLFVSGQGPIRDGKPIAADLETEIRLTLDNLTVVLDSAGASCAGVIRCGVYLADIDQFATMDAVYAEYFPDPKPARTTVGAQLYGGIKIEIDCVAVVGNAETQD